MITFQPFKCISRLPSQRQKQTLPFLNLCWNEEIWTLWSSYGSWWERVSQFLLFRLSAVYQFECFHLKCHCRCGVLPRHRGLPEIGRWRIEIGWCQTLGIKRCLGIDISTVDCHVKCIIWFHLLQIHRDSSSSLSKLIMQSYHQQIDHVSLTGVTPVHMLLEMGLDKMRKDYINYLIGKARLGAICLI